MPGLTAITGVRGGRAGDRALMLVVSKPGFGLELVALPGPPWACRGVPGRPQWGMQRTREIFATTKEARLSCWRGVGVPGRARPRPRRETDALVSFLGDAAAHARTHVLRNSVRLASTPANLPLGAGVRPRRRTGAPDRALPRRRPGPQRLADRGVGVPRVRDARHPARRRRSGGSWERRCCRDRERRSSAGGGPLDGGRRGDAAKRPLAPTVASARRPRSRCRTPRRGPRCGS